MDSIGVVIVTYNRLEKLKLALKAYKDQVYEPKYVLVIDNNSTDGTGAFLEFWEKEDNRHKVYRLSENLGGSGGFYKGMEEAVKLEANWIWLADDDAYPEKDCLYLINSFIKNSTDKEAKISAVSAAVYCQGEIDTWHRRRFIKKYGVLKEERINKAEYDSEFDLDLISYVGTAVNKNAVKEIGYPNKDFFIAYDDSEHSIRLGKVGKIICLPYAHIIHDTPIEGVGDVSWKKYYAIRNKLYSYKKHFSVFQYYVLKTYYILKNLRNKQLKNMTFKAVKDANKGKLGIDSVYKPGWKPEG